MPTKAMSTKAAAPKGVVIAKDNEDSIDLTTGIDNSFEKSAISMQEKAEEDAKKLT